MNAVNAIDENRIYIRVLKKQLFTLFKKNRGGLLFPEREDFQLEEARLCRMIMRAPFPYPLDLVFVMLAGFIEESLEVAQTIKSQQAWRNLRRRLKLLRQQMIYLDFGEV